MTPETRARLIGLGFLAGELSRQFNSIRRDALTEIPEGLTTAFHFFDLSIAFIRTDLQRLGNEALTQQEDPQAEDQASAG